MLLLFVVLVVLLVVLFVVFDVVLFVVVVVTFACGAWMNPAIVELALKPAVAIELNVL